CHNRDERSYNRKKTSKNNGQTPMFSEKIMRLIQVFFLIKQVVVFFVKSRSGFSSEPIAYLVTNGCCGGDRKCQQGSIKKIAACGTIRRTDHFDRINSGNKQKTVSRKEKTY